MWVLLFFVGAGVVGRWRAMHVPIIALLGGIVVFLSMLGVLLGTGSQEAGVVLGLGVLVGLLASLGFRPTAGDAT